MADVEFADFSIKVKKAMDDAALKWLEESAIVIKSEVVRTAKVGKVAGGDTRQKWTHTVDDKKLEATVGNPLENAIWEEFGTGEYGINPDKPGRKGGWYIEIGEGEKQISQAVVDAYGMRVYHGKDGKDYAFTKGKKPKRTLHKAYTKKKASIIRRAKAIWGELD